MTRTWLTLCALALAVRVAHADVPDLFDGMMNPKQLLRGAMLTGAQISQIRELRKTQREDERRLREQVKTLTARFEAAFTTNAPIEAAQLRSLGEQLERDVAQIELGKLEVMLKIRALLSDEQRARVGETYRRRKALDAQLEALPATIAGERS